MIRTAPTGHTYVTTPGSALLFPMLMTPTGEVHHHPHPIRCVDRNAMMPKRRRTRAQNHANYVTAECRRNRTKREARQAAWASPALPRSDPDDDPPPF